MAEEIVESRTPKINIEQLETWAREENWDEIDEVINVIADMPKFILWAVENIDNGNYNIRDLAASILEATSVELTETTRMTLERAMFIGGNKVSRFARFRAAFALFKHGHHSPMVTKLIIAASEDEDDQVSEIAKIYLTQLD